MGIFGQRHADGAEAEQDVVAEWDDFGGYKMAGAGWIFTSIS